jgi:hypothetical protein
MGYGFLYFMSAIPLLTAWSVVTTSHGVKEGIEGRKKCNQCSQMTHIFIRALMHLP